MGYIRNGRGHRYLCWGSNWLYDRKAAWEKAFSSLVSEEDMQKGEDMVKRYGVVAVFIGALLLCLIFFWHILQDLPICHCLCF